MRAGDVARLVVLAAIWGASFIFLRVAAPVLGPVLTALLRVLIAGIALLGYLQVRGLGYGNVGRYWREYLVIGVANSAIPFLLFSFAALYLPASYSAILNSATPLFGALLSTIWLAEPLTAIKLIGLLAGGAGVALVSGAGPVVPDAMIGWAVAACLTAALCYAGAGIYVKKRLAGATPLAMATWSQIFAALAMLPLVPFAPPRAAMWTSRRARCFAFATAGSITRSPSAGSPAASVSSAPSSFTRPVLKRSSFCVTGTRAVQLCISSATASARPRPSGRSGASLRACRRSASRKSSGPKVSCVLSASMRSAWRRSRDR